MTNRQDSLGVVEAALEAAKAAGAEQADALLITERSLEASLRDGAIENVERSEGHDLGLRVIVQQSQAIVSMSKLDRDTITEAANRAVAMARIAPRDPYAGLAETGLLAREVPDLDLWDGREIGSEALQSLAKEAEDAALSVKGVTKSSGAGASAASRSVVLGTSHGFLKSYQRSGFGFSVSVIAGEGTAMERDYDYSSAVHYGDLKPAAEIGREAGERAARRLNPRKIPSQKVPVVYDRRVSASLIGHFASAIAGPSVARGTSFLKDRLGKEVFAEGISIVDDPLRRRGLGSRPFDAEGVAVAPSELVGNGLLKSFLLDQSSARQLKLTPTGHASRSTGSPPSPSPSNLYMAPGRLSREALMSDIAAGFYVTELLGMGVNGVTGDYSRGATGFWIENGQLTFPVSEVTIAGNLKDMYRNVTAADDLEFKMTTNAPTLRVEGMTVAGA
jgi:PmbA protein